MNEKEEILLQEENQEDAAEDVQEEAETTDISDLSDIVSGSDITVSSGDSGEAIMLFAMPEDYDPAEQTNYLLSAILFFLVATWCIDKIKSGIRRLMKHE